MDKKVQPKEKSKKKEELTDAERLTRFQDMARAVGASEREDDFDKAFLSITKNHPKKSS
ncbi:hypothetical protein GALL_395930 [mine drainage metagenome]|uniref:Uncharacterized protein n=1 Tax=mine drainage metagenome TaxID=410659 RepID=A0A1J5Q4U3_9ZZZZ